MRSMKSILYKSTLALLVFTAISCFDKRERNYQYFPDMYVSHAYEAYESYPVFPNGQEAQLPVEGSIPRGWRPFEYPNTTEGYETAKAELQNPLPYTKENVEKGKALFNIYCAICHGDKGDGQGTLAKREKILGIPSYNAPGRNITAGSAYYVMYYGKNTMGSYANQTTEKERWQIAMYVMDLKHELNGQPKRTYEEVSGDVTRRFRNVNIGLNINSEVTNVSKPHHSKTEGEMVADPHKINADTVETQTKTEE